jgi:hypothetical protein
MTEALVFIAIAGAAKSQQEITSQINSLIKAVKNEKFIKMTKRTIVMISVAAV